MGRSGVATNTLGCRNFIEHSFNGLLTEARSRDSLHLAVWRIVSMHTEDRVKMIRAALRKDWANN